MSEVRPIQKLFQCPLFANWTELWMLPVVCITLCAILALAGLSFIALAATAVISFLPGMILGGILSAGALVGLAVTLVKYYKGKKQDNLSFVSAETPSISPWVGLRVNPAVAACDSIFDYR